LVIDAKGDEKERMLTMDQINYITAIREFEGLSLTIVSHFENKILPKDILP